MAKVHIHSGQGAVGTGDLQLQNGAPMDATLRPVTDAANTASPLELSTGLVAVTSTLQIATTDTEYIDAEDGSGNNRFTVSRQAGSQVVDIDFASNPTSATDQVGAIRTYQDGVSLSDTMAFLRNGNVGVGTSTPSEKLTVNGAILWQGALGASQTNSGVLDRSGNDLRVRAYGATAGTGNLVFRTGGGGGAVDSESMRITAAGNVGIGTSSPVTELELGGAVNTALTISKPGDVGNGLQIGRDSSSLAAYIVQRENADLFIRTNNLERMRITSGGYVRLTSASGGIQFNGDTAAANALNDYEEGTWTPVLTGSVTAPTGFAFNFLSGSYTKIGRQVVARFGVNVNNVGTGGAGTLRVTGLPFVGANIGAYQEPAAPANGGRWVTAANAGNVYAFVGNGQSYLEFRTMASNADTALTYSELQGGGSGTGTWFTMVVTYFV